MFEEALSITRRSSGVSSTSAAPRFSSRRCSFVVPGATVMGNFASTADNFRAKISAISVVVIKRATLMRMPGNGVLIFWIASAASALSGYNSLGQSLDDGAARTQLAEEITKKYGVRVGGDLSLTQLYEIIVGLNEICSSVGQDHESLEAEGSRSVEFDEMEARMAMATRINQQYGTSLDWRQYDFVELFLLDQKLRGKSQTAGK